MTRHVIGRDATLSIQVGGEWVNLGIVSHMDYLKPAPAARALELIKTTAAMGKLLSPALVKRSPKNNKLFDRWGRLK